MTLKSTIDSHKWFGNDCDNNLPIVQLIIEQLLKIQFVLTNNI